MTNCDHIIRCRNWRTARRRMKAAWRYDGPKDYDYAEIVYRHEVAWLCQPLWSTASENARRHAAP
jgi:hypothetical protein